MCSATLFPEKWRLVEKLMPFLHTVGAEAEVVVLGINSDPRFMDTVERGFSLSGDMPSSSLLKQGGIIIFLDDTGKWVLCLPYS